MTLYEAITHAEDVAKEQNKLSKRYDDASGYSRTHNDDIRTSDAKKCEKCAEEHRQLAEWLRDYKRLLEQEPCEGEYIKVPKKALKYRTAGMVAYNSEWLKDHFDIERAVICGAQEPCEDTISRQVAIDAFERFIHELGIDDESYNYGEMSLSVKNVPPVTPELKWIPVTERLPEDGERILATHLGGINPDKQVIEHIYKNGKFIMGWDLDLNIDSPTFGQRYMGDIIAWMPLPEVYKEEMRNEE